MPRTPKKTRRTQGPRIVTHRRRRPGPADARALGGKAGDARHRSRRGMEVSKALAFRLLHTLEQRDYVSRDPDHRSSALGFRVLHLGGEGRAGKLLIKSTAPLMDALARYARGVNLYVRTGVTAVCVASRASPHQVRMFAEVGRENSCMPAARHGTAGFRAPGDPGTGAVRRVPALHALDPGRPVRLRSGWRRFAPADSTSPAPMSTKPDSRSPPRSRASRRGCGRRQRRRCAQPLARDRAQAISTLSASMRG